MQKAHDAIQGPHAKLLNEVLQSMIDSYQSLQWTHHLDSPFLPNRKKNIEIIELLRRIVFSGFFDDEPVTTQNVRTHIGDLLTNAHDLLYDQISQALRYDQSSRGERLEAEVSKRCAQQAHDITAQFLQTLPDLRRKLALDIQAAFDGDPAAQNTDEAIFCYPGIDAVFIYRIAHELYRLRVPIVPRIMTEYAHNETGIDIHPGAKIGESFFIDHGTGVVIGETTIIGDRVQIYQGVTLGSLAPKDGNVWRGRKRHPTIEDNVTIYSNATILGGETTIGARCVINGSVFLTWSVPADHSVQVQHTAPQFKARRKRPSQSRRP